MGTSCSKGTSPQDDMNLPSKSKKNNKRHTMEVMNDIYDLDQLAESSATVKSNGTFKSKGTFRLTGGTFKESKARSKGSYLDSTSPYNLPER